MNAKFEIEVVDQNVVVTAFNTPGGTAELKAQAIMLKVA